MIRRRPFFRSPRGPSPGEARHSAGVRHLWRGRRSGEARRLVCTRPPAGVRRLASSTKHGIPAGSALALGLCAVAACALFVPGLLSGAEAAAEPGGAEASSAEGSAALAEQAAEPVVEQAAANANARSDAERAGYGAPFDDTAEAPSAGTLLVELPWGDGQGQVGLARPQDGLTRGPEALSVAPDGRVAVLDSVNKRLVFLGADGSWSDTARVGLAEPRFLAADDELLYVLDCDADRQLLTLDWDGRVHETLALPELPDVVTGLFATVQGPCVEVAHADVFLMGVDQENTDIITAASGRGRPEQASLRPVAGRPLDRGLGTVVRATFAPANGLRLRSADIERPSLKVTKAAESTPALAPGRTVEHLVSIDGDGNGGIIVGMRLLAAESPDVTARADGAEVGMTQPCLLLTKMTDSGKGHRTGDSLLLAESSFAYLGQPYVVAPDGRVLQPTADDAGYSILVHCFVDAEESAPAAEVLP